MADIGLQFKVRADSDQAQRELKSLRSVVDTEVKGITGHSSSFAKFGDSIGLSSTQMSSLAKAAPFAAAGVVAVAGAATAAAVALFNLVKSSADYGSAIFDATEKTGLSAEMMSSLKFAADQSNSSMEELTNGIKIFSKTIGDAVKGSDEAKEKLKRLGIDPQEALKDLQGALAKAFKTINDAPEGILRTNAAMDAFGARMGPNLIGTIKSFDGDLEGLIERVKGLGLAFDDESVRMAEAFSDAYDTITAQAKGIGFQVAQEMMPQITSAMQEISTFVRENKETFRDWGQSVAQFITGLRSIADSEFGKLIALIAQVTAYLNIFYQLFKLVQLAGALAGGGGKTPPPGSTDVPYYVGAPDRPGAPSLSPEQLAAAAAWETQVAAGLKPKGSQYSLSPGAAKGGGGKKAAGQTDEDRALALLKQLETQYQRVATATEAARIELVLKNKEYANASEATKRLVMAQAVLIDQQKEEEKALERVKKARELFKTFYVKQLADLRAAQGIPGPNASDELAELADRMSLLGQKMEPGLLALMQLRALAISGADAVKKLKEAVDELGNTGVFAGPAGGIFGTPTDQENPIPLDQLTIPPPIGLDVWEQAMTRLKEIGRDAFGSLAQGIGSMIEAWVLMGSAGPNAMKKMVAGILAGVAAQAAVLAIFELAKGFAALFFNPAEAGAHFTAAALFGSVALVSAVAGRAIAGNSFAQQGAGAGAGSTAGNVGGAPTAREANIIERERNQAPARQDFYFHIVSDAAAVVKAFVSDVRGNGELRQMLVLKGEV